MPTRWPRNRVAEQTPATTELTSRIVPNRDEASARTAVAAITRGPRCRHEGFIVRRILASLFVIAALLGVGVFATGAYFTDTVNQNDLTFTTGNADLKLGFCDPGVGRNCADDAAALDSIDFGPLPSSMY